MIVRRFLTAIAVFALAAPLLADAPGVYAITGGTVHPVSGPAITNGVVLIRDGLIEAVGANLAVPADAAVIDAKGKHVYPGLIDAQTSLGFPSATPQRRGRGAPAGRPQSAATELPETSPAFMAMREARLSDDDVEAKRATGVTTILTAPSFGIFNGQSMVLDLGGGTIEQRVIRNAATAQISFNPRPAWTYPDSLMGVISYIRQSLFDGQHYAAAHAIYDKNPAGNQRPGESPSAVALGGMLRRDVPVVFIADSELMMRRAMAIAREFNLKYILSGARQAYRMPGDLKDVPVLVSVKWPTAPASKDDREEQPLRLIRERQESPTSPAVLQKSGVLYALVSGPGKTGDFLPGIRKAIDDGLSADDALRAVTLSPARILGVDRQLGSLDKGKIANVVVTDKPIFDKEAKVQRVYIDGREVKLPTEEEKRRGAGAAAAASPLDGAWSLIVKATTGDVNVNARFHVEDGKVTGSFSGDRGSGDIRNGTFDGTTLEFTINVSGQGEQGDWVFHGTLSGTTISGTVSTTLGTLPFSGSKSR
ncbi:MAG TPA: amidohydrolase family protein [Thermoanaerobaculia bacterium]|nr:amidohydrolase family protein [Thermoanaerobaculia bacterium]